MSHEPPFSFDEWVEYCFVYGFHFKSDEEHRQRDQRFHRRPVIEKTNNITRLFEAPAFLADRYSDDQIADGTQFLLGSGRRCEWLEDVRSPEVPVELQARCWRSVSTLYTDLLDRVCGCRGTDPDSDLRRTTHLDRTVGRIWDMDFIEGPLCFPDKWPHLVEPTIEILQTILTKCRTSTCMASALFGIDLHGHGDLAERLIDVARTFREVHRGPPWIMEWAARICENR